VLEGWGVLVKCSYGRRRIRCILESGKVSIFHKKKEKKKYTLESWPWLIICVTCLWFPFNLLSISMITKTLQCYVLQFLCVYFRISRWSRLFVRGMKLVAFITLTLHLSYYLGHSSPLYLPFNVIFVLVFLFWSIKLRILVMCLLFIVSFENLANTVMFPSLIRFLFGFIVLLR
jgi:hypothetical protein